VGEDESPAVRADVRHRGYETAEVHVQGRICLVRVGYVPREAALRADPTGAAPSVAARVVESLLDVRAEPEDRKQDGVVRHLEDHAQAVGSHGEPLEEGGQHRVVAETALRVQGDELRVEGKLLGWRGQRQLHDGHRGTVAAADEERLTAIPA